MRWLLLLLLVLPACATKRPVAPAQDPTYVDGFIHGNSSCGECPDCPVVSCDYSDLKRANQDLRRRLDECLEAGSNDK